ncbi:hypothetical protein HN873_061086, partial [Arachis hypogaea]
MVEDPRLKEDTRPIVGGGRRCAVPLLVIGGDVVDGGEDADARKNSMIEKRHFVYTENFLKENPNITTYGTPSLDARQDMLMEEIPKLGKEATLNAIREWGQPLSRITHLTFYTTSCLCNAPGPDYHLAKLVGLTPTVNRLMIFNTGCHGGGTILRVAKDIAENNAGSRVLVVWAEVALAYFHGPNSNDMDVLVGQGLFGDGAAAIIIGADPNNNNNNPNCIEVPLFELIFASQTTIPNTESVLRLRPQKMGGPAVLDRIEKKLGLKEEKLRASRKVLRQYGNMMSLSVIFVLDEMRKRSKIEGKSTTGEGLEWGVLA